MPRHFALRSIGALALCALTLGACGAQSAQPAPSPGAAPEAQAARDDLQAQDIPCGSVPATGDKQAKVVIRQGAVECAEARTVFTQYFARLSPADAASPSGAGPLALQAWTCGSDPGTVTAATCSTEDGRQIDAQPA